MNHVLASALLALCLLLPPAVHAQDSIKNPLSYSLREYGVILGIALLGGLVRWISAVKRKEAGMLSISSLVGELVISSFAGLLTFWLCESFGVNPLWTAAAAGLAGHAGGSGIAWLERTAKKQVEAKLGGRREV